jgi:hypothetical protein
MNYVDRIRKGIVEAMPYEDFMMAFHHWEALIDLYTLLGLVKGESVTNKDVHDACAVWENGILNEKKHPSLVPYEELSVEKQELDTMFREFICAAVRRSHDNKSPE